MRGKRYEELADTHLHHKLPQAHKEFFESHGVAIDDHRVPIRAADHNRVGGLHCKKDCDGNTFMTEWDDWVNSHPNARPEEILEKMKDLDHKYR